MLEWLDAVEKAAEELLLQLVVCWFGWTGSLLGQTERYSAGMDRGREIAREEIKGGGLVTLE